MKSFRGNFAVKESENRFTFAKVVAKSQASCFFCLRHRTVSAKSRRRHFVFRLCVRPSVRPSGQISLPRYLMNGLDNL